MSQFLLPAEIYIIIFELLCSAELESAAPGYRTSCSLCLVSRLINSIVTPIMYRTLLVDGRTKATLLWHTFQSRPLLSKYARHLFISDHARHPRNPADDDTLEVPPSFAFEHPASNQGRIEHRQRMERWMGKRSYILTLFRIAVSNILNLVSKRLRVLSICFYGHYDRSLDSGMNDVLAYPFPRLTEVMLRDNVNSFPCAAGGLPKLERLYLAGEIRPFLFRSLGVTVDLCPHLTFVELSGTIMGDAVIPALESFISNSDVPTGPGSGRATGKESTTKKLERIVLKPVLPIRRSSAKQIHERLVALSDRSVPPHVTYYPPSPNGNAISEHEIRYPLDEALRNWVDRVMSSSRFSTR